MRLLNTSNAPEIQEFIGENTSPPYAILSHTWGEDEVSFQQLANPSQCVTQRGYRKIQETCALASRNGIGYAWVDTCCIDKTSSAELVEAINSMFHWYQAAAVCYVILEDLGHDDDLKTTLPNCRWFTRGWTLQELIAPRAEVLFFDRDWNCRGSRSSLSSLLSAITLVPEELLCQTAVLSDFSVAQRMSWASRRETTRLEDMAYCLLGIFDVNMGLLYGERTRAFRRLQEEVLQTTGDLSIFAWTDDRKNCPEYSGLLAASPTQFKSCFDVETTREDTISRDFRLTTRGIQMKGSLIHTRFQGRPYQVVLDLISRRKIRSVGIYLRKIGGARYVRWSPGQVADPDDPRPERNARRRDQDRQLAWPWPSTPWLRWPGFAVIQSITLPIRLPNKFPFHPTDPVLGNRHSVIRMSISNNDSRDIGAYVLAIFPQSHWDHQDQLFFCTDGTAASWCAMSFKSIMKGEESRPWKSYSLFVAYFYWKVARPLIFVASIDLITPVIAHLLQHSLASVKFGNAAEVQVLLNGVFGMEESHWLRDEKQLVLGPQSQRLLVTVKSRYEHLPEICVNPALCLDISVGSAPVKIGRKGSKLYDQVF